MISRRRRGDWMVAVLMLGGGWFGATGQARAQAPAPAEPELSMEPVVVTAARIPEALSKTAADVTVITRQELERRQITSVAEALRSVPALTVVQSGTPGSVTSVFARGGNSSHTLVMIDGVRVNSPANGLFDFANLTTDGIERIEVVRGPVSALYGSDGLTAVINIVTKRGAGTPRTTIQTEAGSYQTFREQAQSSGGVGPIGYSVDIARTDSSGKFPHDEYNNFTGVVRLDAEVDPKLRLDFTTRYTHAFKNLPAVPGGAAFLPPDFSQVLDPTQSSREGQTIISLGGTHAPTSWWEHRLQLSMVSDSVDFRDPLTDEAQRRDSTFSTSSSHTETMRLAADWQHNIRPVSWDTVSLGFQADQAQGDQVDPFGTTILHKTLTNYAFYGQNQLTLWDRLILEAGVRADENSTFGTHVTPKFSTAYFVRETGSKLRASYGEGFRAPSINDLAYPGSGNPNLKPEQNRSLEFGLDQSLWRDRIRMGVTWYQSRFRDLIQAQFQPSTFRFIAMNVAHARTQGVEATLGVHPGFGLDVLASYTYLEAVGENGKPLLRRPANTWSATGNYRLWDRVNLNSSLLYVGKRADIDPLTFQTATNFKYVKWDVGASVTVLQGAGFLRQLTAFGKLENLLGVHYQEALGFPALGRRFMLGLSGVF
jgi:vitamin B12 transporter